MSQKNKAQLRLFAQEAKPWGFLSGLFDIVKAKGFEVQIDLMRDNNLIAVDVTSNSGSRSNARKKFTTKVYTPPFYDETSPFSAGELKFRQAGNTEYDTPEAQMQVLSVLTKDQLALYNKLLRTTEKLASDALFAGKITLINGDEIDFGQKASHQINRSTVWSNTAALGLDDLQACVDANNDDSDQMSNICIMSKTSWQDLQNQDQFEKKANFRRIDHVNITPPSENMQGAAFMGQITVGTSVLDVWVYNKKYLVPEGFELANEGTQLPYVPDGKVFVGSSDARFDFVYAAVAQLTATKTDVISMVPTPVQGDFHPYSYVDEKNTTVTVGVRTSPLPIPVDIDSFSILTTS